MGSPMQRQAQRGSTLLVAMIFLLIFGIMAAATFRGSMASVQAIGNMQWRNEAIGAANDAIDRLLSTAEFANDAALTTQTVNAAPFQVDANGDGVNDISVTLPVVKVDGVDRAGPRCLRAQPIKAMELDPAKDSDKGCFGSNSYSSFGASPSLCSQTEWTIAVEATDVVTNTNVRVVQGVGVRVPTTAVPTCN
jgi:type II secretory pathway pseudopilin PulG